METTWPEIIGQANGDRFGISVSFSSDDKTLAIGVNGNHDNGSGSGHVRVYGQNINGEAAGDGFGISVALSGDGKTLGIGPPWNDGTGDDSGHVRLYEVRNDGNGPSWELVGDIDGESSGDELGRSVALLSDSTILAAGANAIISRAGYVRVYITGMGMA